MKFDTFCIFSNTGPPQRIDILAPFSDCRRKVYGHNNKLPSLGTEDRVDSLTVVNLRSYPPSCPPLN